MWNANRGYVGYSMSVRAQDAYAAGEKPLSTFTGADRDQLLEALTEAGHTTTMTVKELKQLLESHGFTSWHHTSKHFNQTDFYALEALFEREAGQGLRGLTAEEVSTFVTKRESA